MKLKCISNSVCAHRWQLLEQNFSICQAVKAEREKIRNKSKIRCKAVINKSMDCHLSRDLLSRKAVDLAGEGDLELMEVLARFAIGSF